MKSPCKKGMRQLAILLTVAMAMLSFQMVAFAAEPDNDDIYIADGAEVSIIDNDFDADPPDDSIATEEPDDDPAQEEEEPSEESLEPDETADDYLESEKSEETEEEAEAANAAVAVASEINSHETLQAAIDNAVDGDVITLSDNFTLEGSIIAETDASYTIDGKGYTVISANERHLIINAGTVTITDIIIDGRGQMGGVEVHGAILIMESGEIIDIWNEFGNGGAVSSIDSEFLMEGGTLQGNYALNGGGVSVEDGTATIFGGMILECFAEEHGGGVYAYNSFLELSGAHIEHNVATEQGGGVYAYGTQFRMHDGYIYSNQADVGGGVHFSGDQEMPSMLTMYGGEISDNQAVSLGGGVHMDGDHVYFYMHDGQISDNIANSPSNHIQSMGGGVYVGGGSFLMLGGKIHRNSAKSDGGGVYALAYFYMEYGEITYNKSSSNGGGAYGISTMTGGSISHNFASYDGGGVYSRSLFTMEGGEISNNSSANHGGGLNAVDNVQMKGGKISNNTATYGGALCITVGYFRMDSGEISGNTASMAGGGIYTYKNPAKLVIHGGEIVNNTAVTDGGGIYTPNLSTLEVRNNSTVADNISSQAYYMTDSDDIVLYHQQIDPTVTWTEEFEYAYNNNDIVYTKGSTEPPPTGQTHTVTVVTTYYDNAKPDETTTYQVNDGERFETVLDILPGYEIIGSRLRDFVYGVDPETNLVFIDPVTRDYTLTVEIDRKLFQDVTITTKYLDGAQPDETITYQAADAQPFSQVVDVLPGYTIVGSSEANSLDFSLDSSTNTVSINSVLRDYDITLELDSRGHTVTVIKKYLDGALPDSTETHEVMDGARFEAPLDILDGYEVIGTRLRSVVYGVDEEANIVYIDPVLQDHTLTLEIDKKLYTVEVVRHFNDASQDDLVDYYSVEHGNFFETTFEVPSGYRVLNYTTDYTGIYINTRTFIIEIDSVTSSGRVTLNLTK